MDRSSWVFGVLHFQRLIYSLSLRSLSRVRYCLSLSRIVLAIYVECKVVRLHSVITKVAVYSHSASDHGVLYAHSVSVLLVSSPLEGVLCAVPFDFWYGYTLLEVSEVTWFSLSGCGIKEYILLWGYVSSPISCAYGLHGDPAVAYFVVRIYLVYVLRYFFKYLD